MVDAEGSNLQYQWYYSMTETGTGIAIPGATESQYTVIASSTTGGRYYYCRVSNEGNEPLFSERVLLMPKYSLSYDAVGGRFVKGEPSAKEKVKTHNQPTKITSSQPERTGYNFMGWGISEGQTYATYYPGDSYTLNNNQVFYAVWKTAPEMENCLDGWENINIPFGGAKRYIKLSSPPAGTYVVRSDSYLDTSGEILDHNGNEIVHGEGNGSDKNFNLEFTAEGGADYYVRSYFTRSNELGSFDVSVTRKYTINYNLTGGRFANNVQSAEQTKMHGEVIDIKEDIPTKEGYVFFGWSTSPDAATVEYDPGESFAQNADVTLYAVWVSESDYFVPIINVNDGEQSKIVTMISKDPTATIYYTTDSSEPDETCEEYTGPIVVEEEGEVVFKAIAIVDGMSSSVTNRSVTLTRADAPKASVESGMMARGSAMEIIGDGTIYYSINGGAWQEYEYPIVFDVRLNAANLRIYMSKSGYLDSETVEYNYELGNVERGVIGSVNWQLNYNILTISGNGEIRDFEAGEAPWYRYADDITKVIIEEPIDSIGKNSFYGLSSMESVEIPDTVLQINEGAFDGCESLEGISLPKEMSGGIAVNAFRNCKSITSVEVPENIKTMGEGAFYGCTSLASLTIPFIGSQPGEHTETFGYIFANTESHTVDDSPEQSGSSGMTDLITADNVPESLKTVIITKETNIPENAFASMKHIRTIDVNDGIESIGNRAFDGCAELESFSIPDGINMIGDNTFRNCSNIRTIDVPDSATMISEAAFDGCAALRSIHIPDGITHIYSHTFRGCSSLREISIPVSVTNIEQGIFEGCTGLYSVEIPFVGASVKPSEGSGNFGYFFGTSDNSRIPAELTLVRVTGTTDISNLYKSAYIPANAFANCSNIEDIVIDGGYMVHDYAFANCKNLKHLYIPESVTQIGEKILEGCDRIEVLTVPFIGRNNRDNDTETSVLGGFFGWDDVTKRGIEQSYNELESSHYYKIPDTLTNVSVLCQVNVPTGVFERCHIEKVSITRGRTLGERAFSDCQYLKEISLPYDMEEIGKEAFANCIALETINIPERVRKIDDGAFYGATSLMNVTMPNSVTDIADMVFNGTNLLSLEDNANLLVANGGTITCSLDSEAEKYAIKNNIKTNIVPEEELNIQKTSSSAVLLSDMSYLIDITDPYGLSGTLHVELYDNSGNLIDNRTCDSGMLREYRMIFQNSKIRSTDHIDIYVSDDEGNLVSTGKETILGANIPQAPRSSATMIYDNGVLSFDGTITRLGVKLIEAVYDHDDRSLVNVVVHDIKNSGDTIKISPDSQGRDIKLMLWEDAAEMRPLDSCIEIPGNASEEE